MNTIEQILYLCRHGHLVMYGVYIDYVTGDYLYRVRHLYNNKLDFEQAINDLYRDVKTYLKH